MQPPDRLATLRTLCLIRDRHRCVITCKFDFSEAMKRYDNEGVVRDDDGNVIDGDDAQILWVAHILPHFLTRGDVNSELVSHHTKHTSDCC